MLSILFNILLFAEIFSLAYGMIWLADLYFSNQTYIRDIYLIIALLFCILLNMVTLNAQLQIIPILTMMIIQLNSMFLLSRVESSTDKWKSNIYKAFSFFFALYAIVSQNWVIYFVSFTFVIVLETLFSLKLGIEKLIKVINYITYISAFLVIYFYFQNKIGNFELNTLKASVLFLNIILCSKCFCRIKQIKDYNI
jgi:hypothetical protein